MTLVERRRVWKALVVLGNVPHNAQHRFAAEPIPFETDSLDWLARTQPTVSPSTHALHEWAVDGYLIPAFNVMPVQVLRPDGIERWQAALLSQGKPGRRSVQIIRGVLHAILEDAIAKGSSS